MLIFKKMYTGLGCDSVVKGMFTMCEALGWVPSTTQTQTPTKMMYINVYKLWG